MTMQSKRVLITAAVAGVLAAGTMALANPAVAGDMDKEKCYGVAKAGKNDCAGNGHACSGQAKKDADSGEWISLPKGTCERLLNGRAVAEKAQ
jgi:uncharacterized membrane protein